MTPFLCRVMRTVLGKSQVEFSRQLKLPRDWIARYEGSQTRRKPMIKRLAASLHNSGFGYFTKDGDLYVRIDRRHVERWRLQDELQYNTYLIKADVRRDIRRGYDAKRRAAQHATIAATQLQLAERLRYLSQEGLPQVCHERRGEGAFAGVGVGEQGP